MLKRVVLILFALVFILGTVSCRKTTDKKDSDDADASEVVHIKSGLFGFIAEQSDDLRIYEAMHSFVTNCEELGVNAKLYKLNEDSNIETLTDEAIADNCDAVLFCTNADAGSAMQKLEAQKIRTVSLISENNASSCSVVLKDCTSEIVEMLSDGTDYNSVLIYSSDDFDIEKLNADLESDGYSTKIKTFKRTDFAYKDAQEALYSYLVNNTSIKAIYAIGEQNARPAALAANQIGGIRVIGCEISNVNKELFDDGLYALSVSPYYEMTAKAVYAMKNLADGKNVDTEYCTVHIVTEDKLDKYAAISENAQKWFEV